VLSGIPGVVVPGTLGLEVPGSVVEGGVTLVGDGVTGGVTLVGLGVVLVWPGAGVFVSGRLLAVHPKSKTVLITNRTLKNTQILFFKLHYLLT